jgi:hypothetical protein
MAQVLFELFGCISLTVVLFTLATSFIGILCGRSEKLSIFDLSVIILCDVNVRRFESAVLLCKYDLTTSRLFSRVAQEQIPSSQP